jgi:hypothetical protein
MKEETAIGIALQLEGVSEELQLVMEDHPALPRAVKARIAAVLGGLELMMGAPQEAAA